jgi:hypothetical protein
LHTVLGGLHPDPRKENHFAWMNDRDDFRKEPLRPLTVVVIFFSKPVELLGVCAWAAATIKTSAAAQPISDIRMLHSNLTEYLLRDVDLRYAGDIFQKFHSRRKPDLGLGKRFAQHT